MSQYGFTLTAAQARVLTTIGSTLDENVFLDSYAGHPEKTGPVLVKVGDAAMCVLTNGDAVAVDSERIAA